VAIGVAAFGAWSPITATVDSLALVVGLAVACWIACFHLLYACQDIEFDRANGLHSVPARFGIPATLRASSLLHILTVASLIATGLLMGLGAIYWLGVLVAAGLLVYEHSLLTPGDLSRLDLAFFNVNGYIAVILFVATSGDLALSGWLAR